MIHLRKLFLLTCLVIILSGVTCLPQILDPNFNCRSSLRNTDVPFCLKSTLPMTNKIGANNVIVANEEEYSLTGEEGQEINERKQVNPERNKSSVLPDIEGNLNGIEEIQQKFAKKPLISIRGLVSSGTNWFRQLIQKNCNNENILFQLDSEQSIDADGLYGWKHALILKKEIDLLQQTELKHSIIALTRDALTWIQGAFKMKSYVLLSTKAYRTRVLSEYASFEVTEPMPHGTFYLERYYEKDYLQYMLRASSVFALRKIVYQNYLEASKTLSKQIIILRYEDLLQATQLKFIEGLKSIEQYENCFNNKTNVSSSSSATFDEVQTYVKYGMFMQNQKSPQHEHSREKFCNQVTSEEEYSNLLNLLDLDFEKQMGYTYPVTRADYCLNTNSAS